MDKADFNIAIDAAVEILLTQLEEEGRTWQERDDILRNVDISQDPNSLNPDVFECRTALLKLLQSRNPKDN